MSRFPHTFLDMTHSDQPRSETLQRLMDLGYITGKRITLHGEHFEVASVPFIDGNWVAVRVSGEYDPTIQTIRLPISLLLGLTNLVPAM